MENSGITFTNITTLHDDDSEAIRHLKLLVKNRYSSDQIKNLNLDSVVYLAIYAADKKFSDSLEKNYPLNQEVQEKANDPLFGNFANDIPESS